MLGNGASKIYFNIQDHTCTQMLPSGKVVPPCSFFVKMSLMDVLTTLLALGHFLCIWKLRKNKQTNKQKQQQNKNKTKQTP